MVGSPKPGRTVGTLRGSWLVTVAVKVLLRTSVKSTGFSLTSPVPGCEVADVVGVTVALRHRLALQGLDNLRIGLPLAISCSNPFLSIEARQPVSTVF
jgi:hypothetical protein